MKKVIKDGPPVEVATEMLTACGARLTNKDRKMFARARQVEWTADVPRKPLADRLRARTRTKSIQWLDRECRRYLKRRGGLQRKYESLNRLKKTPVVLKFIAALDLRVAGLDAALDAMGDEILYRQSLTRGHRVHDHTNVIKTVFGTTRGWVDGQDWVFRRTEFPRWVAFRVACLPTCA